MNIVIGGVVVGVDRTLTPLPDVITLEQNVPNPFNPTTMIRFHLAEPMSARLTIYDAAGRRVRVLVNRSLTAGQHGVVWDGRDDTGHPAATGVYFYVLDTQTTRLARRMVLLK